MISYVELLLPSSGGSTKFNLNDFWDVRGGNYILERELYTIKIKYLPLGVYVITFNAQNGWIDNKEVIEETLIIQGKKGSFQLKLVLARQFRVSLGETMLVSSELEYLPFTVKWAKTPYLVEYTEKVTIDNCAVYHFQKRNEETSANLLSVEEDVLVNIYNSYEDDDVASITAYDKQNNIIGKIFFV